MSIGRHLANRKWPCYPKNWDSSGVNNHSVHLCCHLNLPSKKRLLDAQPFLNLVYSGLRRNFVLDAIVFLVNWYWLLYFKWTKTKMFVFIMHSESNFRYNSSTNKPFLKYPANIHNVSLRTFVECIVILQYTIEYALRLYTHLRNY